MALKTDLKPISDPFATKKILDHNLSLSQMELLFSGRILKYNEIYFHNCRVLKTKKLKWKIKNYSITLRKI